MTAQDLLALLRRKYAAPAYIFLEEVGKTVGFSGTASWIDAMVVSQWPSNPEGLIRIGIEIKVSRGDFLSEIRDPNKNAWVRRSCHQFLYAAPDDVIKIEEIPAGCGWLAPTGGGGLRFKLEPKTNMNVEPLTDEAIAALVRAANKDAEYLQTRITHAQTELDARNALWGAVEQFIRDRGQEPHLYRSGKSPEAHCADVLLQINQAALMPEHTAAAEQFRKDLERFEDQAWPVWAAMTVLAHRQLRVLLTGYEHIDHFGTAAHKKPARSTLAKRAYTHRQALRALLKGSVRDLLRAAGSSDEEKDHPENAPKRTRGA